MEYEKPIQATSFSKKLSSGGLMATAKAHPYDGVFVNGRSGSLGAVVDGSDYAEIFRAGSTACSIPVLDIPELFDQGTATSGGGRSSRPADYSKIFGGLGDSTDFAVPFEELLPQKPNISNGASTRTPAETRTRSRGRSRQLSFSEEKLEPSRRPPEQPLAGVKEFNVLHNRTIPGSQNGESRTARVAELHADVGGKAKRSVVDDARIADSDGEPPKIPKLSRRAVSGPQSRVDVRDASQRYVESRRRSSRSGSMSNDMFDAFGNGVGAHSSGIPSPSSTTSKARGASRTNMPEHEQSNHSPSFSDEEVDANSVAAASAAAVRKAIEEAQAKIKLAKELMERKKEGRVNFAKMNFGNGVKADKKVAGTVETLNSSREKEAQAMDGKEQTPTCIARMSNHGQRIASQVSPDFRDKKEFSTAQASGGLHEKESSSCLLDQTAEAYGNERASIRGSESDIAVKHDSEGTEVTEENTEQGKKTREIEIVPGIFQWKFDANSFKSTQELEHEEEHDLEIRNVHDLGEADQAPNLADEHEPKEEELESKLEEFKVEEGNDMLESQGDNRDMPEMSEAISGVQTIDNETEGCSQKLEDTGIVEVVVRKDNEMRLHETNLLDGKPIELESTESQENREESSSPEADEYRESNGSWELDNEMEYVEICEENVIELRSNDLHGKEESNSGEGEDGASDKDTVATDEQILGMGYQVDMRDNQLEGSSEADRMHSPTRLSTGDKEDMEVPQQASMDEGGKYVDADAAYNHDEIENFRETEEGGWYEETLEGVSVIAERMESPADANGNEENDREWEGGEDAANGTVEVGFDAVAHAQVFTSLEHTMEGSEILVTMNNTESAAVTDLWSHQKQAEGLLDVNDRETRAEEGVCESDESDGDTDESEVGRNEEEDESNTVSEEMIESHVTCVFPERTVEEVEETVMSSDMDENNVTDEDEIASIHGEDDEIASIHGEEDNASQSSQDEKQMDNQMHVETAEQPSSSEGVGRMTEVKFQSSGNKEESHDKAEKKEVESQSEAWIQNIRNLKKDELREKERQRIVVDRAIKEARERAFAEARERAERAAADKAAAQSRQRETAAASKRPEKTPSEANVTADKAAKNAKLKAERAAVERATNEARERALEKALAEKAAAKARNQAAKTASENFSSVSRDDAAKSRNDRSYGHQQNGNVTSSSLRQSSSHHDAEKSGVPNNVDESAYWSKATLEKHQRTAERAAKALAEKNIRDLLAQREQAERHRLAETLDADVTRWLSGKERNLRALLSTLQYIVGSDSGWQPIPLTDLVSTAAVKKAYRKATLIVHPDKLQQRGASIQQKYTCEKVFDLLKEAWNKFSAEER